MSNSRMLFCRQGSNSFHVIIRCQRLTEWRGLQQTLRKCCRIVVLTQCLTQLFS